MVPPSSDHDSENQKDSNQSPDLSGFDDPSIIGRKFYFINEIVENKLRLYLWTKCTSVPLRDSIMEHAEELIRQIIRKQKLHQIYPGQEESAFNDLVHIAYAQIERTLYKFRAEPHCRSCFKFDRPQESVLYRCASREYGIIRYKELFAILKDGKCPHCRADLRDTPIVEPQQGMFGGSTTILFRGKSKVFNLWSQVARTVILAFVKKDGRDRKNAHAYLEHLQQRPKLDEDRLERFFLEAAKIWEHNESYLQLLKSLQRLIGTDERPYDGLVGKLVDISGQSRPQVTTFLRMIRLRSNEFTDSPINRAASTRKYERGANHDNGESE